MEDATGSASGSDDRTHPSSQRTLNPKLTARRAVRPDPPPLENEDGSIKLTASNLRGRVRMNNFEETGDDYDSETESTVTTATTRTHTSATSEVSTNASSINVKNMAQAVKLKNKEIQAAREKEEIMHAATKAQNRLKHDGNYIQGVFNAGRKEPFTACWSCCGEAVELTLYCKSQETKDAWKRKVESAKKVKEAENAYRELKLKTVKTPWDERLESDRQEALEQKDNSAEDRAMEFAASTASSFNAPMLCSWLYKNVHEEPTVLSGMKFLKNHLRSGEGCQLMVKHDIVGAIEKIYLHYRQHPPLQFQCVAALRILLDCNLTRDLITNKSIKVLRIAFSIAHLHMNSRTHVDEATACISQCARAERCRQDIMGRKIYAYVMTFCKRYQNTPSIIRSALKLFNWVSTTNERIIELCEAKVIQVILRCMRKHDRNAGILAPAILFITRSASIYPPAMAVILKMKAVPVIIKALMALYSDEYLQLEGLKMLQTISKTSEGWKQISDTRGGWQIITQGTDLGNQLIHDLPGEMHNPGWAIGDTNYLPVSDRNKMKASATFMSRMRAAAPKASWTPHALRGFMGISMKETKLAVNTEFHDAYFELLETLELLPRTGEEKEYWFIRLKEYEHENHIELEEMTHTMIALKKRDIQKEKERIAALAAAAEGEQPKEVYVHGEMVTTQMLSDTDLTIDELIAGVVKEEAPMPH